MIVIKNRTSKNLFGASNSADLLLARSIGVFSIDDQQTYITNNYYVCESHIKELLTKWYILTYEHFDHEQQNPMRPICSFPTIEPFNNLHTKRTKTIGTDLPQLTKQQAEFVLTHYGILLHPGLCKNFYEFNFKFIMFRFVPHPQKQAQ